jgi:hypothetical protein
MNRENVEKLIAWVKTREDPSRDWLNTQDCAAGMVATVFGVEDSFAALRRTLDIGEEATTALYVMEDFEDGVLSTKDRDWTHLTNLGVAEQNEKIVGALTTLLDSNGNRVKWDLPTGDEEDEEDEA